MISSKKFNIVVLAAVIFALLAVSVLNVLSKAVDLNEDASNPEYVGKVFGSEIISVDIIADESDWQEMLDNAISESYIMADVIVNGTRFNNVGIRPKGNSSLSQVAASDSDRYSFRIQFDEYIEGQTCFGLQSFVVNNMLGDTTYMKEYISYDLMREIGVDAPLTGFADIRVNGEAWGLYLAVELYNDSYETRVFGDTSGMLYNVKSREMGGGENKGGAPENEAMGGGRTPPDMSENGSVIPPQGGADGSTSATPETGQTQTAAVPESGENIFNPRGMGGGMGGEDNGGSLQYIDDDSSSYGAIFDNVVGKGSERDYNRVIQALEALSEGRDLEEYFDMDQILRYLAAHTVVVNLDSYSSGMAQNYYIYEREGQITLLPWDYNLAWGGFQSSDASSVVNFPIDTPVSGVALSERPLLDKLFENEEYLARYHEYLQEMLDGYFSDGKFQAKIESLNQLIGDYVKNDATAFYTYEEYQASLTVLTNLGNLRAESIQAQLDGSLPGTTQGQAENPELLISAEGIDLTALGTMGGGGGRMNGEMAGQIPACLPGDDPGDTTGQRPNQMNGGVKNPMGMQENENPNAGYPTWLPTTGISLSLMILTTVLIAKRKRNY